MKFGNRVELLIDDELLESTEHVSFELQRPERRETVLTFEKPWENPGSLGVSVFQEKDTIKLYYRGYPKGGVSDEEELQATCLAVSSDGVHFSRKPVNQTAYLGEKENNIVFLGPHAHNFAPFYDLNPNCSQEERYKAIAGSVRTGGLCVYQSADGLQWKPMWDQPVITEGSFDSLNTAFFDITIQKYRCYSRWSTEGVMKGIRAIQSCVSDDFIHWEQPRHNLYDGQDKIGEEFYTNATRPIPGAEHILVSFPMRFCPARKKLEGYPISGVSDCIFLSSRDGVNWNRAFRKPWISPGLDEQQWTQRNFIVASGIVEIKDEFCFYVEEHYMWADCSLVQYTVPRFRLGSVCGAWDGGRILTKELELTGDHLYLNYATSAVGSISVAVLDQAYQPIDGFGFTDFGELYGNELEKDLLWNGQNVSKLRGNPVHLEIRLKDAQLFAIGGK